MGKLLPTILDTKFENILSHERLLAKTVANAVIGQNQVAVWDVLIPIVFLFNFLRFKRAREIFALNFMFTKKLALQGALDMIRRGQSKEDALAQIKNKTNDILASDKEGVYSIKIRQRQMREIDLIIDHYYKLLNAEGKDYATMVKNTYKDREDYAAFIAQLEQVEEEVIRAATQTVKTSSASGIASKIEETTDRVRAAEIERIFGGRSS
jgi:plasmid maintenance system killer protein